MKKMASLAVGIVAVSLALVGCSSGTGGGTSSTSAAGCADYSQYGTFKGKTVSMYSGIVAPLDQSYIDSFKKFESCTGITIQFQGDKDFDSQIKVRIDGGNAPDVAVFAQPSIVQQFASSGKLAAAPKGVTANLDKYYSDSWKNYVSYKGKFYGSPLDANAKSFVWYSPKRFADAGYKVPTTLDGLMKLSDKIAATGAKPWCDGIGAGDATGWPITDWMSQMMLTLNGPEAYDKWVNHDIAFNSAAPTKALNAAGDILKNPKFVNGGLGDVSSIASTDWQDAGLPVVSGQCAMYRQGSFYAQSWPEGTKVAKDGDVFAFYFPSASTDSKPVIGGGDFVVAFDKRPEVQAFQTFLSSPTWANAMVAATPNGGWVTANTGMDASKLKNPIDELSAQILQDKKAVFRYGGADLMPPSVGASSFWTQSTDWILGKSTKATLDAIEASWPKQ